MKKIRWTTLAGALIMVLAMIGSAVAVSGYLNGTGSFNATYGTATTALDTCNLCHPDGSSGNLFNPYATAYRNAGHNFAAIEALDSDGDGFSNIAEITARTFPGDATSRPADTTPPTVTAFAIPATATSLTVLITTFTATDLVGVTGYLLTETATAPVGRNRGLDGDSADDLYLHFGGRQNPLGLGQGRGGQCLHIARQRLGHDHPGRCHTANGDGLHDSNRPPTP